MSKPDFSSMTVIELRKMAKEYGVTLGAGLNKEKIIAKLDDAILDDEGPATEASDPAPVSPAPSATLANAAPVANNMPNPARPAMRPENVNQNGQLQFRAAWHNPSSRYGSRTTLSSSNRSTGGDGWGGVPNIRQGGGDPSLRVGSTVRPTNFSSRFGPSSQQDSYQPDEYRSSYDRRQDSNRSPYGDRPDRRTQYDQRASFGAQNSYGAGRDQRSSYDRPSHGGYEPGHDPYDSYDQRGSYDRQNAGYDQRGSYDRQNAGYDQRGGYDRQRGYDSQRSYDAQRNSDAQGSYDTQGQGYSQPRRDPNFYDAELGTSNPAVGEMLASGECADGEGILELHPEGYGFLRAENTFLPSSRDIYVSMAQIKRFELRNGDRVVGKTRPQREGDKYGALLYITEVNGIAHNQLPPRTTFDELTPTRSSRRINLEMPEGNEKCDVMRLVDLIAPIGFGFRSLVLCPPETGKRELLRDFANTIVAANPGVEVLMLLIDEMPEEVTLLREQCHCPVLASTFDMSPDTHLRLTDLVLERAERLVEQQKDVVLIVDSLTRLSKTFTVAAAQAVRSMPGMVNPSSLFRAKRLYGAARNLKEGGSLTVIGTLNIDNGSKVDDAVVEEFLSTANSELVLDGAMLRMGVTPPVNLQRSRIRPPEMILSPERQEGIALLRSVLGATQSVQAVPQLMDMMDKAATNDELLLKLKDWVALMKSGRPTT